MNSVSRSSGRFVSSIHSAVLHVSAHGGIQFPVGGKTLVVACRTAARSGSMAEPRSSPKSPTNSRGDAPRVGGAGQQRHAQAAGLGHRQRGDGAIEHVGLELHQRRALRAAADGPQLPDRQARLGRGSPGSAASPGPRLRSGPAAPRRASCPAAGRGSRPAPRASK